MTESGSVRKDAEALPTLTDNVDNGFIGGLASNLCSSHPLLSLTEMNQAISPEGSEDHQTSFPRMADMKN